MTTKEFEQMCVRVRHRLSTSNLELASWLMIEAGELADHILKNNVYGKRINRLEFLDEAGDVLHLLQALLTFHGFNLDQAMISNRKKMISRGWIEGEIDG